MIRDIDATSREEIQLVAGRMRETLIEVEGLQVGGTLYTLDWLEERVRWHLNPESVRAKVLVGVDPSQRLVGHTIFRVESDEHGSPYGLISTTYVVPTARRGGLARRFLRSAEHWFLDEGLNLSCTWTSPTNAPLVALYRREGYKVVDSGPNDLTGTPMIKLGKVLRKAGSPDPRADSTG